MAENKIRPEWIPNAYGEHEVKTHAKSSAPIAPIVKEYGIYPTKISPKNKKSRR